MTDFINAETGETERLEDGAKEEAYLSGRYGITGDVARVVDPESGKKYEAPVEELANALNSGLRFETDIESAQSQYLSKLAKESQFYNRAKAFTRQVADEALMGIPELAADSYQGRKEYDEETRSLTEYGERKLFKEKYSSSNLIGGLLGGALSVLYGGPALKGAGVAGQFADDAVRGAISVAGQKGAREIVAKAAGTTANAIVEGAAISAPFAAVDGAASVLGDQQTLGEALISSGYHLATGSLVNAGVRGAIGVPGIILKTLGEKTTPVALNDLANKFYFSARGALTPEMRAITKEARVLYGLSPKAGESEVLDAAKKELERYSKLGWLPKKEQPSQIVDDLQAAYDRLDAKRDKIVNDIAGDRTVVSLNPLIEEIKSGDLISKFEGDSTKAIRESATKEIFQVFRRFQEERGALGADGRSGMTTKDLVDLKGVLKDMVYGASSISPLKDSPVAQRAYGLLDEMIGKQVDKVGSSGAANWKSIGEEQRKIIMTKQIFQKAADRSNSQQWANVGDRGLGVIAALGTGDPITGLATMAGSAAVKQYGARTAYEAIKRLSKVTDGLTSKVQKATGKLAANEYIKTASQLSSVGIMRAITGEDKPDRQISKMQTALSKYNSDPEVRTAVSSALYPELEVLGTEARLSAVMTLDNVMSYLQREIPKPGVPPSVLDPTPFEPSAEQVSVYSRKVQAALDPESVIDELQQGTATREQFDAIKQLYPRIWDNITIDILGKLSERGTRIPQKKRAQLALMLGDPTMNKTGAQVQALQANFVSKPAENIAANSKITESARYTTDLSRVISG